MTKTVEGLRKIINEQEAALLIKEQQRLFLDTMEKEALERLKERLADEEGMDKVPSIDLLQELYKKSDKSFELQSASDLTKARIFENFAKEFGKENIHNNRLNFPDDPDSAKANTFFSNQAQNGHAFLFKQENYDNYAFSDGNGHYKMGSKAEIVSYCKQNSLAAPFETKEVSEEQTESELPTILHR